MLTFCSFVTNVFCSNLFKKQIYMIPFGFFKCNFATEKKKKKQQPGFLQATLQNKTLVKSCRAVVSPSLTFHMVTEACDRLSFSFWGLSHFLSYTWSDLWRGLQGCSHHLLNKKQIILCNMPTRYFLLCRNQLELVFFISRYQLFLSNQNTQT